MGRGDKRTKRGKISMGSFGKKRVARRTARIGTFTAPVAAEETAEAKPKAPRKKAAPKKTEEGTASAKKEEAPKAKTPEPKEEGTAE